MNLAQQLCLHVPPAMPSTPVECLPWWGWRLQGVAYSYRIAYTQTVVVCEELHFVRPGRDQHVYLTRPQGVYEAATMGALWQQ